jgi:hypothetical protein
VTRLTWKLDSVHLKIVVILSRIGAQFAPNIPFAQKSFWMHPMLLLGDEAQEQARFSLFRDTGNLDARQVHGLHQTYRWLRNRFGPVVFLSDEAQVHARFSSF